MQIKLIFTRKVLRLVYIRQWAFSHDVTVAILVSQNNETAGRPDSEYAMNNFYKNFYSLHTRVETDRRKLKTVILF